MILPPTKTKCKITNTLSARTFLNQEHPILKLQEISRNEKFIFDYTNQYWLKKRLVFSEYDKKKRFNKSKKINL